MDEAFVRRHFPGEDPLGRRIVIANSIAGTAEIVGVVGNIRQNGLDQAPTPTMYVPFAQESFGTMRVLARTGGDASALAPAVRTVMRDLNRDVPAFQVALLEDVVGDSMASRRFPMILLGSFGAIALLLTAIGLYGVLAYTVTQQTREIGVRLAIGAALAQVLSLVLRHGLALTGAGALLGTVGALGVSGLVASMLFEVTPFDPLSYLATGLLLVGVGALACWLPARRAMRVDPLVALRSE